MFRKLLLITIIIFNFLFFVSFTSAKSSRDCTVLGPSDNNTFKEYCYKITDAYLSLRNKYKVDGEIDTYIAGKILNYSKQGLNYLPDDLTNKNYYTHLQTAIERGIKEPKNITNFDSISTAINDFLNLTKIEEITGDIDVFPASGNAPLTVTFRGNVSDPTGSKLQSYNYTWWILDGGRRKNIGNGVSLNYTFREEGNFTVFLDVTSNHRNSLRNTDVIPFSKKVVVSVKEKAASLILKVNNKSLDVRDELKFTPEESIYGLLFDATSSTPTSGTKFISTEWDFGNGVLRKNDGAPRIERVVYASEGEYKVLLKLKTNTGKVVERRFNIIIRNPIASINTSSTEGYLGDKFIFTANSYSRNENLTYFWEIVDLKNDKVIFSKNLSNLSYSFNQKGRYNIKLSVTSPSGEKDFDNKIIHVNSRAPIPNFTHSIPNSNKPNTIFLDASGSYDLDFSDDGKLEYSWIINGDRVNLDNPNFNGSNGYFTFENIGEQSVILEVRDPDDLSSQKSGKINISSNLSVDLFIFPRVSQVGSIVKFVSDSPKAKFYEWDFGDGTKIGGKDDNITHKYSKAGIYTVNLSVRDENDLKNTIEKIIYIGDADNPYANIKISGGSDYKGDYGFKEGVCNGKGAYIVNKVDNITLSGIDSIDVTGLNTGLDYSWKIGNSFYSTQEISRRFDDIGCIPVKLTVKSQKNGKESSIETYLKVENIKPELTGLDIQVNDLSSDPVIVDVKALGAVDKDGVIQSYLWYYYTDVSNEPQDFRATRNPSTTFVLPKITGTYYFVAVLKDNNEERTTSADLYSKYFITLTGDNVNTPIVGLSANNTSIKSGEEVVFTANVSNILGQDISSGVKYSWDFDGDGFYDLETNKNIVSHKFKKSGEYRVKLKVKNKGFSNTKTLTVNVSNILKPSFDYISIGNDFIFFDKSEGNIESYSWDMGDGQVIDKKGSFIYTYSDGKPVHIVKLTIFEGSTKKEFLKKVVRDFGKMISTKKEALSVFSNYSINNDKIILKEETSDLQIFLKTNLSNVKGFAVDFNTENDSDLNGGKDDDEDNKNTTGYTTGGPINIELNNKKNQNIKLFLKDENGKIIETKELKIEKEYLKEEEKNISLDSIKLEGVSPSIKNTFNKLKESINTLDSENKFKSLTYLQKLQEEWSDVRERTNIIMEFSNFIREIKPANSSEIISLLEGMLVDENEKADDIKIVLTTLKNLIPKDIACTQDFVKEAESKKMTCYDLLTSKLQFIYENNNLNENKSLGKEILSVIEVDKIMTNKQKMDFKPLLSKLINKGGELTQNEKKEIVGETNVEKDSSGTSILFTILKWIFYIILGIFLIVVIGIIVNKVRYNLSGNKEQQSFSDYVAEKTNNKNNQEDVLSFDENISNNKNTSFDPLKDDIEEKGALEKNNGEVPSWLKGAEQTMGIEEIKEEKKEYKKEENFEEENLEIKNENNGGEIPDWLKAEEIKEEKKEYKKEENFEEENLEIKNENNGGEIPDWLKTEEIKEEKKEDEREEDFEEENLEIRNENNGGEIPDWLKTEEIKEEKKEDEREENFEEENLEIRNENNGGEIPDWLKTEEIKEEKKENKREEDFEEEPKLETKEDLDNFTKIDLEEKDNPEDNLPDWLKGSFEEEKEKLSENKNIVNKETKSKKIAKDDFANFDSLSDEENTVSEKKTEEKPKRKRITKSRKTVKKSEKQPENPEEKENKDDEQLWEDGMKIPDWLKTDEK